MIKNIFEMKEVIYCMYCGSKLERVTRLVKKCPKDCVEITFQTPQDIFSEIEKERKQSKKKGPECHCEYPLIS